MSTHRTHARKVRFQRATTPLTKALESRPFAPPSRQDFDSQPYTSQLPNQQWQNSIPVLNPDPNPSMPIQPKLTIGAAGDKYEQEANRVAEQVVQQVNRTQAAEEQPIQRQNVPEEEDKIHMKPLLQCKESRRGMAASEDLESSIQRLRGQGQPLSDKIREPMEQAFGGVDFSGVTVHTDAQSDQLNQSIQAKAFTTGQDIFFLKGEYEPGSRGGQEILAHELTHVVQQKAGDVRMSASELDVTHSNRVIQRMTYVLPMNRGHYKDEADYNDILADAQKAPHRPLCTTPEQVKEAAQNGSEAEARELHIFAHGNQAVVGSMTINELHAHLKDDCGVNNPIRRTRAIILHSCMSGDEHAKAHAKSPAEEIYKLQMGEGAGLAGRKKRMQGQVSVVGFRSRVFTDRNGKSRCLYPVFWQDIDKYESLFREVKGKCTPEQVATVEESYLLSEADSRVVFEGDRDGKVSQETINAGIEYRASKNKPYTFDSKNKGEKSREPKDNNAKARRQALENKQKSFKG